MPTAKDLYAELTLDTNYQVKSAAEACRDLARDLTNQAEALEAVLETKEVAGLCINGNGVIRHHGTEIDAKLAVIHTNVKNLRWILHCFPDANTKP